MTAAYPLSWPEGFPRAKSRARSLFKSSLAQALKNVEKSVVAFGTDSRAPVRDLVISSNVSLGVSQPADPGVAVWFSWDGEMRCIAVDRYAKVEENLQAIHYVIEARRTELRHGTLALVRAAMSGLKALPPPEGQSWREVLGFRPGQPATADQVREAHRARAADAHPDRGGSTEAMAALNRARDVALKEVG